MSEINEEIVPFQTGLDLAAFVPFIEAGDQYPMDLLPKPRSRGVDKALLYRD
jgi:hypothetical protein